MGVEKGNVREDALIGDELDGAFDLLLERQHCD